MLQQQLFLETSPMLCGSWMHKNPAVRPVQCPQPPSLSQSIRRGAIHPRVFMIICFNPIPASPPPPPLSSISMLGAGAAVQSSPAAAMLPFCPGVSNGPMHPALPPCSCRVDVSPLTQHVPKAITGGFLSCNSPAGGISDGVFTACEMHPPLLWFDGGRASGCSMPSRRDTGRDDGQPPPSCSIKSRPELPGGCQLCRMPSKKVARPLIAPNSSLH